MAERVMALRFQEEKERRERLKRKRMSQSLENIPKRHPVQFLENGGERYEQDSEGLEIGHRDWHGNGNGNGNSRRGSKSSRHAPPSAMDGRKDVDQEHLSSKSQLSPRGLSNGKTCNHELDSINMAVGQRTPELRTPLDQRPLPSPTSVSAGLQQYGPLRGLHLVVTHVKDTLEDDVDVAENILASLERLEKDKKLGCTFSLSEQGRTFYF